MDELDRLRAAHATLSPPTSDSVGEARRRLERTIRDAGPPRASRVPRRRRRRRTLALASLALGAALVAIVALWPTHESGPGGPSTALAARLCEATAGPAAPCLNALGDLAAATDVLAAGKVFYRRDLWSQSIAYIGPDGRPQAGARGPGVFGIVRAGTEELWVGPDHAGRIAYGPAQRAYLPSPGDEQAWKAAGSPDLERLAPAAGRRSDLEPRDFSARELDAVLLGDGGLNEALPKGDPLRDLSADPATLHRQLDHIGWYQRVRISGDPPCAADLHDCTPATRRSIDGRYGINITVLLRYPFTPPELRRALLRLLGAVPGARRLGTLTDPAGRRAAAILIPEELNDGLNVVLFDLRSGRLISDGEAPDGTIDTLRWHGIYDLEVGAVDAVGERP